MVVAGQLEVAVVVRIGAVAAAELVSVDLLGHSFVVDDVLLVGTEGASVSAGAPVPPSVFVAVDTVAASFAVSHAFPFPSDKFAAMTVDSIDLFAQDVC